MELINLNNILYKFPNRPTEDDIYTPMLDKAGKPVWSVDEIKKMELDACNNEVEYKKARDEILDILFPVLQKISTDEKLMVDIKSEISEEIKTKLREKIGVIEKIKEKE